MAAIGKGGAALLSLIFGLCACGGGVPPNDVAQGIGFQDRDAWLERQATLRGEAAATHTVVPPGAPDVARASATPHPAEAPDAEARPADPVVPAAPTPGLARVAAHAIAEAEDVPPVPQPAVAAGPAPPASGVATPGISDEQDFDAVADRERIESDAERRARMQAERVIIQPTALPARPGDLGPNIIGYALSTDHAVGERRFARRPISTGRHQRNCQAFRAADLAQEWFLENGGPRRDRRGLDPDGDGYACSWDPAVYRAAAAAARN
jgi:hypothetical protein